jgi:hypothetical protein
MVVGGGGDGGGGGEGGGGGVATNHLLHYEGEGERVWGGARYNHLSRPGK